MTLWAVRAALFRVGDAVAVGGVGGVLSKGGEINFDLQQTGEVFLFCFGSRVVVEHARKEKRKNTHSKICSSDKQKINDSVLKILQIVVEIGFVWAKNS